MKKASLLLLPLLAVALLAGCDTYEQDDYAPEYIVEAYLVANEPLPTLKLSTTAPIDATYSFEAYAVSGATVVVNLLNDDGAVEESYPYVPVEKGLYGPADGADVVQPLRRYALEITPPENGAPIRASTFVPGPLELISANTDTVTYQSTDQLEARVTRSFYPGRQNIYVFVVEALDTTAGLTPFYKSFADDGDLEPEDVVLNATTPVNEENYDIEPDGTLTLRLPWVGVAFYGPNNIVANAIDDNVYDFLRSQTNNGTQSPGEMQNLIDHVEGGRGVFGSMARDAMFIYVKPNE